MSSLHGLALTTWNRDRGSRCSRWTRNTLSILNPTLPAPELPYSHRLANGPATEVLLYPHARESSRCAPAVSQDTGLPWHSDAQTSLIHDADPNNSNRRSQHIPLLYDMPSMVSILSRRSKVLAGWDVLMLPPVRLQDQGINEVSFLGCLSAAGVGCNDGSGRWCRYWSGRRSGWSDSSLKVPIEQAEGAGLDVGGVGVRRTRSAGISRKLCPVTGNPRELFSRPTICQHPAPYPAAPRCIAPFLPLLTPQYPRRAHRQSTVPPVAKPSARVALLLVRQRFIRPYFSN